jgi:hypothetical protein
MNAMETILLNDYVIEFDPAHHQYRVNNKKVISVTQLIDEVLGRPYLKVDPVVLQKAADRGTALHDMIERYEKTGDKTSSVEFRSYMALKGQHQIGVLENEKIVVIEAQGTPIAAGRFDMIVKSPFIAGIGIADVKRTLHLNEERLKLQLNLYKRGYEQTYKKKVRYLKCMHIRNQYYNYVDVPVDSAYAEAMIQKYLDRHPIAY